MAKGTTLPFKPKSFDRVFMLDVVEHLTEEELNRALSEVRRVTKTGGQLIIHTNPNLNYYNTSYRLYTMFVHMLLNAPYRLLLKRPYWPSGPNPRSEY